MKQLNALVLVFGLVAGPAAALAQSRPSPPNQAGPGVSPSVEAPTDMGLGNEAGSSVALPQPYIVTTPGYVGTTGSAVTEEPRAQALDQLPPPRARTNPPMGVAPGPADEE